MPFSGVADIYTTGSMSKSTVENAWNNLSVQGIHARVYFLKGNASQSRIIFKTEKNVPNITINLKKIDEKGEKLSGATFKVTNKSNVGTINGSSSKYVKIGEQSITVTPASNTGTFKLNLKETTAPSSYKKISSTIELTVNYDKTTGTVTSITSDSSYVTINGTTVSIKNEKKTGSTSTEIRKVDFNGNPVAGVKFKLYINNVSEIELGGMKFVPPEKILKTDENGEVVTTVVDGKTYKVYKEMIVEQNGYTVYRKENTDTNNMTIYGLETDEDGKITVDKMVPDGTSGSIYITLVETEANGYEVKNDKISLIYKWNYKNNNKWLAGIRGIHFTDSGYAGDEPGNNENEMPPEYLSVDGNNLVIQLKNDYKLDELDFGKFAYDPEIGFDSTKSTELKDAKFNVTINNVKAVEGYSYAGETLYFENRSLDEIDLKNLVFDDEPIEVILEETSVPAGYKGLGGQIKFKISREESEYVITDETDYSTIDTIQEFDTESCIDINDNKILVSVFNVPAMSLKGKVWKDGQIGEKNVQAPNGLQDDGENGVEGVLVRIVNAETGVIERYNINGERIDNIKTNGNGEYEFKDIPKIKEGYIIVFSYDGINWIATEANVGNNTEESEKTDSDATEIDREGFNKKFKTIRKDEAINEDNTETIPLSYTYDANNKISTLNVDILGNTTGTSDGKFQISAQTGVYYDTTENIDCGLVRKVFDLALGTDVEDATLTINDKSTTYNYAQVMNGALEDLTLDNILQNHSDIIYNLYLEDSDYRFRIEDYRENKEKILNNVYPSEFEEKDTTKELQAFVKYSVILKNQSTYEATVDEFVYYYDSVYTPEFKKDDVISGYKVKSIETENNKITFERVEDNLLSKGNDYRKEIELTFRVNKDENGIILKDNISNVAEITKYTTVKGGLIDADSAPDNANVTLKNGTPKIDYDEGGQDEDDSDEAPGLKISIKNDSRTVSGIVTDDKDGDGILESSENKINGVVVQLIELHEVDKNNDGITDEVHEYIWQETKTGSNKVVCTPRNGYSDNFYTYENSVTESDKGKFEFKHFIPGNYIIRYIYGDVPRAYSTPEGDIETTKKYNGQDYKSTIDTKYNVEWYNGAGYTKGQSVARDNEARRLQVMAHSAMVNEEMYITEQNKIKEKIDEGWPEEAAQTWKYHFTWMAAETSKLNVTIDNKVATTANSTNVSYNDIKADNVVKFADMDFGITLRPQNKLVLEKHITGLKIGQEGVQEVVDAKANIEKIMENGTVEATGLTTNLKTIKADRHENGMWYVAIDVEELAQGSELVAEYTYVIKNEGQEDYLSAFLVNEYEKGNITEYINVLNTKAQEVKGYTRCNTHEYNKILGEFYYTGEKASTDKLVTSRVEEIEECINNQLNYQKEIAGADFKKTNTSPVKANIYDSDGNLKETDIDTVVSNVSPTKFLNVGEMDYSKTLTLTRDLSSITNGEMEGNYPSYIAEIKAYSNAAGRIDMEARIANLSYVHSDDKRITLDAYLKKEGNGNVIDVKYEPTEGYVKANEYDEFWAERIIISEPTGQNKVTPILLTIVIISGIAVMGTGIILIKKFVLKR